MFSPWSIQEQIIDYKICSFITRFYYQYTSSSQSDALSVGWVKIRTEDFTDDTLAINDTYEDDVREIVVLVMEVDKVADEVTDVKIDK